MQRAAIVCLGGILGPVKQPIGTKTSWVTCWSAANTDAASAGHVGITDGEHGINIKRRHLGFESTSDKQTNLFYENEKISPVEDVYVTC